MTYGRVHSLETLGALDGPGLRCVVFLQGCPLRCQYCHNPDTWAVDGGTQISSHELVTRLLRYRPYFAQDGGVTLSGGEPLLQAGFAAEVLQECHEHGIHTALDTSGCLLNDEVQAALAHTDLVILDIKHTNADRFRQLTGGEIGRTLEFLAYVVERNIPLWVRQVIVPGLNDTALDMAQLAGLLSGLPSLQRVELLPYHTMALDKWQALGLQCPLSEVPPPTPEAMAKLDHLLQGMLPPRA